MDEFLYQNATEDVGRQGAPTYTRGQRTEQVWERMDNSERAELAQLRAAAPAFGRRSNGADTGFGRRAGKALALCPSQRAQIRHKPVDLSGFAKR